MYACFVSFFYNISHNQHIVSNHYVLNHNVTEIVGAPEVTNMGFNLFLCATHKPAGEYSDCMPTVLAAQGYDVLENQLFLIVMCIGVLYFLYSCT
jgi:hypothetical protein